MESGVEPEKHDEFIELVTSSNSGFLHLFSQHQLQVPMSLLDTAVVFFFFNYYR